MHRPVPVALLLLSLLSVLLAVAAINIDDHKAEQFRAFVVQYKKDYRDNSEEYALRQQIFLNKLEYIEAFNKQDNSFKVGINEHADLTDEEYASKLKTVDYSDNVYEVTKASKAPPASLDWRTHKPAVVGPVREMGQCGSSGAISIVDSISSDYSVRFNTEFHEFNTAYITDCDGDPSACNGGLMSTAWNFIKKFGLQWSYEKKCPTACGKGICITGPSCVAAGNEDALLNAVADKGPISVVIDASRTSFQLYTSGIYSDSGCSTSRLDHALLLVGYGSQNGQDYWILRNEWGALWGMNGDILLARNKNNMCGIATSACYATTVNNCTCVV